MKEYQNLFQFQTWFNDLETNAWIHKNIFSKLLIKDAKFCWNILTQMFMSLKKVTLISRFVVEHSTILLNSLKD